MEQRIKVFLQIELGIFVNNLNLQYFDMLKEHIIIDKLVEFKQRDKFSVKAWKDKGLNPSDDELCQKLTLLFNTAADNLMNAIHLKYSGRQLKATLKNELYRFNKLEYDTEEKEFICALFYELSTITNIEFKDHLNSWLYGYFLSTLLKIKNLLNPERIIDTIKQPCTNCGTQLESYVMKKEKGIPDHGWYVVKCDQCKALNLLSCGADIKQIKFGNYEYVETLTNEDYTPEEAMVRLEQIKYFRK
jgi:hypothetical protein